MFESSVPFDYVRIQAAAVYCSDGRFGEQVDDFLHNGLQLPRYDRVAIPGGAACLAGHFATYREADALIEQLHFLLNVHRVRRVVLIAHKECAYYIERLHVSPLQLETLQRKDMAKAALRLRAMEHGISVTAYMAQRDIDKVTFEPVEV